MFEYGTRLIGLTRPAPETQPLTAGKAYQVTVQASTGILDPKGVADFLSSEMRQQYPELQIVWMKVCEKYQTIDLQFTVVPLESLGYTPRATPLFIGGLLVWLPLILTLIGISAVAISIWDIVAGIPWWTWALLGTGVILFFFGPSITKLITGRAPEQYRPSIIVAR